MATCPKSHQFSNSTCGIGLWAEQSLSGFPLLLLVPFETGWGNDTRLETGSEFLIRSSV